MTAVLVVASATLAGSFICSLFEAALYSITPSQIGLLCERNVFGARKLAKLRAEIEEPIAAILTINTITHTVGSAWCGALVADLYGGNAEFAVGLFAAIFTFCVLFFTEIVPKSIGVTYAVQLGPWIAWPLQWMIWLVWPLVKFCGALMQLFRGGEAGAAPTEDEILIMARLALQAGMLRAEERRWVENALRLDRIKVRDLMTPRTVVYSLPADLKLDRVKEHSAHWIHSRLPLTEDEDPDKVVGLVHRRDVFDALVKGQRDLRLRDLMHEIDFVPETMRGHQLLDKFIKEKKHIAAVVNEYGGFEGVVSLEDVLECLLGAQIVDEFDRHVDLQELARQRAKLRRRTVDSTARPAPREKPSGAER